jgi:ubiquinone biosynthesis protein UbiJ
MTIGASSLHDVSLDVAERWLNRYVSESTAAMDLLEELAGSSFAVRIEGTGLACVLIAETDRIALKAEVGAPTATLRAAPIDLLRLVRAGGVASLKGTRAELTGDLQIAERFAELLRLARPDFEDELSRWIGDVAAHEVGRAVRHAAAWLGKASAALRMNAAEYLQEESRALPAALEAEAFYGDVERLRDDVERAAARLQRLERQSAV